MIAVIKHTLILKANETVVAPHGLIVCAKSKVKEPIYSDIL